MAVDLEKMKKLLSHDLPQVAIAQALGCDESYISQLLADDKFAAEVAALKLVTLERATNRDDNLDTIEDRLLQKIGKTVEHMYKPQELFSAYKIINGATRRGTIGGGTTVNIGQVVQVMLPNAHSSHFIKNVNNEIIEAEGRSLATLPSSKLLQIAAATRQKQLGDFNGQTTEAKAGRFEEIPVIKAAAA